MCAFCNGRRKEKHFPPFPTYTHTLTHTKYKVYDWSTKLDYRGKAKRMEKIVMVELFLLEKNFIEDLEANEEKKRQSFFFTSSSVPATLSDLYESSLMTFALKPIVIYKVFKRKEEIK
jgi:hypothetical protein